MDPLSLLVLAIAGLAGLGLAAVLGGAESRDGFDRAGHAGPLDDRALADRRPGANGPAFR